MERATGFEPATSTLARLRATNCAKPASQVILYARPRTIARVNLKKSCTRKKWLYPVASGFRASPRSRMCPRMRTFRRTARNCGQFGSVSVAYCPRLRTPSQTVRKYGHLAPVFGWKASTIAYTSSDCTQAWTLRARSKQRPGRRNQVADRCRKS